MLLPTRFRATMTPVVFSLAVISAWLSTAAGFGGLAPAFAPSHALRHFTHIQTPLHALPKAQLGSYRAIQNSFLSLQPSDRAMDGSKLLQRNLKRGGRTLSMTDDLPKELKEQQPMKSAITYPVRVCVFGGGSFGLAMASALGRNNFPVTLHVRSQAAADSINDNNEGLTYLKGIKLPSCVHATTKVEEALEDCTHIVHAIPCQYSRKYLEEVKPFVRDDTPVISTSKGIETGTLALMNEILKDTLGETRDYAFLSGPSFAKEIASGLATAVVIASESDALANEVAEIFSSDTFRAFTSRDVEGVEIGGAVKNVIAIAAGMVEGLGLGTNAMAGLVTRGCFEMQLLARTRGASPSTLMGLSGVGDTFGTCFGPLSRNRQLGYRLGQGEKLEDILSSSTEVAEGYATALSLVLAHIDVEFIDQRVPQGFRMDLKFPIFFGVAEILKGERTPLEGMEDLMLLPIRMEFFDKFNEK